MGNFEQHIIQRTAHLFAPGVGDDTVGAVFGAPFHDGDIGGGAFCSGLGQGIEFLDFGEGDIHLGAMAALHLLDHLGKTVQGLGAEDDVHLGRTLANGIPFLGGHAAADGNHQIGIVFLQLFPASQLVEQFLLGFFPDGTGIQHQHIGLFGQLGGGVTLGST